MTTQNITMLKKIEDKYQDRILSLYRSYLFNPTKISDLCTDVYILTDASYDLRFRHNTRALCKESNGKIYIRQSDFSEYVLIHEYIHRLARNVASSFLGMKTYRTGIADIYQGIHYVGFNEILTEWIATSITGVEPEETLGKNIYQPLIKRYEKFLNDKEKSPLILKAYFNGDGQTISELLMETYSLSSRDLQEEMNLLSEHIIKRIPLT